MADLGNIASFAYSVPEIALALSVVGLFIVKFVSRALALNVMLPDDMIDPNAPHLIIYPAPSAPP